MLVTFLNNKHFCVNKLNLINKKIDLGNRNLVNQKVVGVFKSSQRYLSTSGSDDDDDEDVTWEENIAFYVILVIGCIGAFFGGFYATRSFDRWNRQRKK